MSATVKKSRYLSAPAAVWTADAMRAAGQMVVVVHHAFPPTDAPETPGSYATFGDGQAPPAFIRQYGTTLQLVTPHWY